VGRALFPGLQVFARGQDGANAGLTPGFLQGPRHQELVRGRAPRHRGNYAGKVLKVNGSSTRTF
jgi:putative protease